MAENDLQALSEYRLEKASEMLSAAKRDYAQQDYASANNRAYYCIFHAMRAVLALRQEDYKKTLGCNCPLFFAVSENGYASA